MSYYGLALQAIGDTMQLAAATRANKNIAGALQGEQQVQKKYQQQALGDFYKQLAETGPTAYQQALQGGAAGREALYGRLAGMPMQFPQANQQSVSPMRDANLNAMLGGVRARLGAYGDASQEQYLANQNAARNLAQIQNFAAGQHSLLPYELYQAQHREDWLNNLGRMFSNLGGGASAMGMGGQVGGQFGGMGSFGTGMTQGSGNGAIFQPQVPTTLMQQRSPYANQYGMPYFTLY